MVRKVLVVLGVLLAVACTKQKSDKPGDGPAPSPGGDHTEYGCAVAIQPTAAAGDAGAPTFEGTAKAASEDAAHKAALEAACAKAGETGDCVASGKFVRTGGSTSREVVHGQ